MTKNFMALVPKIDKIGYDGCRVQAIKGQGTGGRVLAIPHNGNLSNGRMFADVAHPLFSPNDEFADYETWDVGNLDLGQSKPEPHK